MSTGTKPAGRVRAAGRLIKRVLVPFSAMRTSVELAKKELSQARGNIAALKELARQAHLMLRDGIVGTAATESFNDAMRRRRSRSALTLPELEMFFLRRKRAALAAALVFLIVGLYATLGGLYYHNTRGVVTGILSLLATQPIFFVIALEAQFRVWQLRTRRLSREEHGGLQDFMREVDGWVWETLKPNLRKD